MKTMLKKLINAIEIDHLSALLTWMFVSGSAIYLMWQASYSTTLLATASALYVLFIVAWILVTTHLLENEKPIVHIGLISFQYLCILGIYFCSPYGYSAILVTIWSAQLPYFLSLRRTLMWSPVWSAPLALIFELYWHVDMVIGALLFWMFNIFALIMVDTKLKESRALEEVSNLNRELMATQELLGQATKQTERIRIARNIHDLLGHHLTALTINLQVAARTAQDDSKQQIDECYRLSKLLLNDVRDAVLEIREKSSLDLRTALNTLIENIPKLNVTLAYDDNLEISDVNIAETLLRSVQESLTNSLKHSNATHFNIDIKTDHNSIKLQILDNGNGVVKYQEGHGLTSMRERVLLLDGDIQFSVGPSGFSTKITLPEQA